MAIVDYITFCHHRDYEKLHSPGVLLDHINSHNYEFNKKVVIHQRLRGYDYEPFNIDVEIIESEDYPNILSEFNIPEEDTQADEFTHGPSAPHYWKWHVINHLIGLKVSQSDYIVFSDGDCKMVQQASEFSWIQVGINLLKNNQDYLIISPSDGGNMEEKGFDTAIGRIRLTQNVSQQLFLCRGSNQENPFKDIDFNVSWNWETLAPGGPMQEYYYMLEGRIWRYMHKNNFWRAILPASFRYWHLQW